MLQKLILVSCLLFSALSYAGEHWYTVRVIQGNGNYDYYGTVSFDEADLQKAIQSQDFIHITNLVYFDNQNKIKNWSEWAWYQKAEIFVKSENIVSFHPLTKDPRENK